MNINNSTIDSTKKFAPHKLIVCEKPSVAQQFAQALKVYGRKDGYLENNEWMITWCVGHLVSLSYPEAYGDNYKKWNLSDLPFLPLEYKYEGIKSVKDQYKVFCLSQKILKLLLL